MSNPDEHTITKVFVFGIVPSAAGDVLCERKRQIEEEGWNTFHDDQHTQGDLCLAGACYALNACWPQRFTPGQPPSFWPWAATWWKPKDNRRDLVRAAALLIAEIERIDRNPVLKPDGEK